ncbi:MAG: hypothetical protein GY720_21415 [bacterium]|nr:hypothetical protein [bacterium]
MSEFDPFAVLRTMDGPVEPPEAFGEDLYVKLRSRLDESAVGAPQLAPPPSSLPQRGFLVAVAALVGVLLMVGMVSWLSPAEEGDVAVDPPLLSRPEISTSSVEHNPDPAVIGPGISYPATTEAPPAQNRGGYQFGGWQVLPASQFDGRQGAAVVWTGDQLLVWGGYQAGLGRPLDTVTDSGGVLDPANDVWISMPPSPLSGRAGAAALWTGDEMLIMGGGGPDAAAYDPATRLWRELERYEVPQNPAAVWTGSEAILWGGPGSYGVAYDAVNDRWRNISTAPASEWSSPEAVWIGTPKAVWTGTEMIVWGVTVLASSPAAEPVAALDIAAYNPATDSWRQFAPSSVDFELSQVAGVWTGTEILLFGANFDRSSQEGELAEGPLAAGVGFNPGTEEWRLLAETPFSGNDLIGFGAHSLAWSGSRMLIWVGEGFLGERGPELWAYDPVTDSWERGASSPVNAEDPELIWTGNELYAYGGIGKTLFRTLRIDLGPDGAGLPDPVGTTSAISLSTSLPFQVLAQSHDLQQAVVADLAAGRVSVYAPDESLLPRLPLIAAGPLWDGWLTSRSGEVWWYPDGITRHPIALQNESDDSRVFAGFTYFLSAGDGFYPERIWTVAPGAGYGEFDEASIVRQISVLDGSGVTLTELPPDAAPVVASRTGLLINQNGWAEAGDGYVEDPASRKMMLVEPDGSVTPLWHGWGLDLSVNRLVWLDCDDEGADCRVMVSALTGPQPGDLVIGDESVSYAPHQQPGLPTVSPDGRWLIIEEIQTSVAMPDTALVRIDLRDGTVHELITYPDRGTFAGPGIVWSYDSEWVMVMDAGPMAVRISDGMLVDLSETVLAGQRIYAVASR